MSEFVSKLVKQIEAAENPEEKNHLGAEILQSPDLESEMINHVTHENAFLSLLAIRYISQSPNREQWLEGLIEKALYLDDQSKSQAMVNALRRFPKPDVEQSIKRVGALIVDVSTRSKLVFVMSDLDLDTSDETLQVLIEALSSEDQLLVQRCTEMLVEIGEDAAGALLPMLGQSDPVLQQNATNAMIAIGKPAVPYLIKGLGKADQFSQQNAYRALSEIGADAHNAVSAAVSSSNDILKANAKRLAGERSLGFLGGWFKRT